MLAPRLAGITLLIASALLVRPPAAVAQPDLPGLSLAVGFGVASAPHVLDVEPVPKPVSGIVSWTFEPPLAVELRGSFMNAESADVDQPPLEMVHVELNLTYSALAWHRLAPFATAGVGGMRMRHADARAVNAGAGLFLDLSNGVRLRFDARDVAYRIPGDASAGYRNTAEAFVGFSFDVFPLPGTGAGK